MEVEEEELDVDVEEEDDSVEQVENTLFEENPDIVFLETS